MDSLCKSGFTNLPSLFILYTISFHIFSYLYCLFVIRYVRVHWGLPPGSTCRFPMFPFCKVLYELFQLNQANCQFHLPININCTNRYMTSKYNRHQPHYMYINHLTYLHLNFVSILVTFLNSRYPEYRCSGQETELRSQWSWIPFYKHLKRFNNF